MDSPFQGRRVLFFLNWLRDGAGMINREIGFSEELAKRGAEVTVLSHFKPEIELSDAVEVRNVVPTSYRNQLYRHPLTSWWIARRIRKTLRETKPEIVFVDLPSEAAWALQFREEFGYRVVFTYHGVADSSFYSGEEAEALDEQRAWCHELLKQVDQVIVVSDFLLAETSGIGVEATRLHNGVDLERCAPDPSAIQPSSPTVVFVGRYTEYKGALNIVKAFVQTASEVDDAELIMYGYKEREDYMKQITDCLEEAGVRDRVQIHGPLGGEEMMARVNEATIFANGSLDETFCMPLLEAEACGKACVAFAAGGIPEVVLHQQTGLLAQPGDIEEYAAHLSSLLSDTELRERYSAAALEHAGKFTYALLSDHLEEIVAPHLEDLS